MRVFYLYYENKKMEISPYRSYSIGRSKENDIVLLDTRVSRRHALLEGTGECFRLKDLSSSNGSWMEGKQIEEIQLNEEAQFRLGNCNCELHVKETSLGQNTPLPSDTMIFERKISEILDEVQDPRISDKISELKNYFNRKKEGLADLAYRDGLTGLFNRRYFDRKMESEFSRGKRYARPLSLIMVDIDLFKKFNDTYGHQKGDEVLAGVARILEETSRDQDILCRYGGEEMSFILPETTKKQARDMAEFCRRRVEENSVELAGVKVTISLGVSEITPQDISFHMMIQRADEALYKAKESGRNRVEAAP